MFSHFHISNSNIELNLIYSFAIKFEFLAFVESIVVLFDFHVLNVE